MQIFGRDFRIGLPAVRRHPDDPGHPPLIGNEPTGMASARQRLGNLFRRHRAPVPTVPANYTHIAPLVPQPAIDVDALLTQVDALVATASASTFPPQPHPHPQPQSSSLPAPLFVNPAIGTVMKGSRKQYTLDGAPVFEGYRKLPAGSKGKGQRRTIGEGMDGIVLARRNVLSKVYVKRMHQPRDLAAIQARCSLLNELAALLAQPGSAEHRDHFAAELLKGLRADGAEVYYLPAVNGFTLDRYLTSHDLRQQLPRAQLKQESEKLKAAMQ